MRDLDRLQRGIVSPQRKPTRLGELIARAVAETENPAGRPIEIEAMPDEVEVDAAKVERIIENLVANALRHTPVDARIWVRAGVRDGGVLLQVDDAILANMYDYLLDTQGLDYYTKWSELRIDALNHAINYSYDAMSNLTSMTDALNRVTNYEYDDFTRLRKITYPPATTGATRLFETTLI